MLFDRPSRSDLALNHYWNALNAGAPGDELERLASEVEPSELAALHRARASKQRFSPDPLFVRQLEVTLMINYATIAAGTIPQAQPGTIGRRVDSLDRGRRIRSAGDRNIKWSPARAIAIIAVTAIILGIVAGIWLASRPNDGVNNIQPASTPVVETTPDAGSDFPMYRGNSGRTGVVNAPGPSGSPVERWTLTGLNAAFSWSAAVFDGVLYAGAGNDGLIAVDALTGERLWSFLSNFPIDSAPAVGHGLVFFANTEGRLFAVDLNTHEERWGMDGIRGNSAVALAGELLYAVTPEGTFYALNVETGAVVWEAVLGSEAAGGSAVAEGIAVQHTANHTVHAFDAITGEPLWTFAAGDGGSMFTATIAHGIVYSTTEGNSNDMFALNAATGELIWQIEREAGNAFNSATATADRVFSISQDGVLHAIDARDGSGIWTYQLGLAVKTMPILAGNTLYIVDNAGFVRAISAVNGSEIWSYPVEGPMLYGLSVAGDTVYAGTGIGNFYAITGSDSLAIAVESVEPLASSPVADSPAVASPDTSDAITGSIVVDALFPGGPGEPLQWPLNLAQAPNGQIWVTDGPRSRFQIFEPDGTFVEIWGERGTEDGQFNFVRGNGEGFGAIAFAPDGSFWVADTGNARVQHFDADRNFVKAFGERGTNPGQLISAISVGVDSGGNVWVNDDRRGMLVKYGPDGAFLFEVGGPGQKPGSLTDQAVMNVGPDDSVWVTGSTTGFMHRWSSDGTLIGSWEHASLPGNPVWTCSIDFDEAGNLYILDPVGPQVFVMTSDMELIGSWSIANADGTGVPSVLSMIVLSDGSLALPDVEGGTVLIFHLDPPITD